MRLGKSYGDERLEAACRRALTLGACSYKSIESILKKGLDRHPVPEQPAATPASRHVNIRGPDVAILFRTHGDTDTMHLKRCV
jgi:hypothetical protein